MKCEKCKKETINSFTSKDNKEICSECLEKEIYKERIKISKKYRRLNLKRLAFALAFIGIMLIVIGVLMK